MLRQSTVSLMITLASAFGTGFLSACQDQEIHANSMPSDAEAVPTGQKTGTDTGELRSETTNPPPTFPTPSTSSTATSITMTATGTAGATLAANAGGLSASEAVQYPYMRFNGQGLTHCDDSKDYGPYVVKANVEATVSDNFMNFGPSSISKTENFNVTCFNPNDNSTSSECQDSNPNSPDKLVHSNTITLYQRLSADEIASYKQSPGANYQDYLIYAKGSIRSDGFTLSFNPPIPIGVWTGDANRYGAANGSINSWNTNVTLVGTSLTFPVAVYEAKMGQLNQYIQFRIQIDIPAGDNNYDVYSNFPMPFQGNYTIDTNLQAVVKIDTISRDTNSDSHCIQNSTTEMTFTACDMTLAGKTTPIGCTFGQ